MIHVNPSISFHPTQTYSSMFTYLPTSNPNESFLGFFRCGKEDQVTEASWEKSRYRAEERLFAIVREKFLKCNHCLEPFELVFNKNEREKTVSREERVYTRIMCRLYPIGFASDKTRIGILLTKIPETSPDSQLLRRQIEINEFAVKALCKMSIEAGIDKKQILKQVRQVKEEGYVRPKSYCELESKTLKTYELKEILTDYPTTFTYLPPLPHDGSCSFLGFSRYDKQDQITEESWRDISPAVHEKIYRAMKEPRRLMTDGGLTCSEGTTLDFFDATEAGIGLKKLTQSEESLWETAEELLAEEQMTPQANCIQKIDRNNLANAMLSLRDKRIENPPSLDSIKLEKIGRTELNFCEMMIKEEAVNALCNIALEAGSDKAHILKQIQRAVEEGFLLKSYYDLQWKRLNT